MTFRQRLSVLLLGLVVPAFTGCGGQRLLEARIEKDDKILLRTHYSVSDRLGATEAWQQLENQSFEATGRFHGSNESETMTLDGEIRVTLLHADNPFAVVDVHKLRLIRDFQEPQRWHIASDDIKRTAAFLKKK